MRINFLAGRLLVFRRRRSQIYAAYLPGLLAALFIFIALIFSVRPAQSQATPVRIADASCGKCHADIQRSYLATPMANASGLATEKLNPGTFEHKSSGSDYALTAANGKAILSYRNDRAASTSRQWDLSYFLGSGHLAITYTYSINNFLFESPVAWYAASKNYDMKPGLAELRKAPPSLPMQSDCLRCHMSSVQASDPGTINRYQGLAFLHTGITCEGCHGDAEQHVLKGDKTGVVNPARLSADRRDSICMSCHLEGDVAVDRARRSPLNYVPGDSISSYVSYYVYRGANLTTRGVSEVEQLAQSTCKRASGDKMSCTSCHDPHFTPDAQQRTAFFRGKCLACHSQPQFATTHHPENPDCTSCHMTPTGSENIPHVAWTDHRILRLPEKINMERPSAGEQTLVPIFSPDSSKRDLAMAYYKALLEGNQAFEPVAWKQLNEQRDEIANDPEALDALGNMNAKRGEDKAAEQIFRQVLTIDPKDLTALSNLSTLLARQGKLQEATALLHTAFDRNQNLSGLAMNLARVECAAGDATAARSALQTTLVYNPDLESVQRLMTQLSDCAPSSGKK